jgi:hypothetical protein
VTGRKMTILGTKEIKETAREIVLAHPEGIRFKDIVERILSRYPDATNRTTIEAQVANYLVPAYPGELSKPSRGLYVPIATSSSFTTSQPLTQPPRTECEFYEVFASYLQNDLEEATVAVPMGGAGLKGKWGTPDVVGVYRPLTHDLVKFTPEIVVAEIKIDPYQPVVAFGQAIAYRLFATRAYVVMPKTMSAEDLSRLESLCQLFGLGLVLFNPNDPRSLNFRSEYVLCPCDLICITQTSSPGGSMKLPRTNSRSYLPEG